jgi:hypothetical protein
MGFRDKPEASELAAPGSPARCETVKRLADAQSPHRSSPPRALAAMLPCCHVVAPRSDLQTRNPPISLQFHAGWLHRCWFHGIGRLVQRYARAGGRDHLVRSHPSIKQEPVKRISPARLSPTQRTLIPDWPTPARRASKQGPLFQGAGLRTVPTVMHLLLRDCRGNNIDSENGTKRKSGSQDVCIS